MVNLCLHSLPSVMSYCSLGCHNAICDVPVPTTVSHCCLRCRNSVYGVTLNVLVLHHCLCGHIFVFVTPCRMQFFVTHCCVVSHYYTRCHISVCNVALLSVMTSLFLSLCNIALCSIALVSACSITSMLSALLYLMLH